MTSLPEPIRINFIVTADDVIDGSRAYAQHRSKSGLVVGATLVLAAVAGWFVSNDWYWLLLAPVGLAGMGSGYLRSVDRASIRARPELGVGKNSEMEFTDSGLQFTQGAVEGLIRWSAVTEVREGEAAILLLQDRRILANIPKRAFRSTEDLDAARSFLATSVPSANIRE
jgi:hypothetical protein